MDAIRHVQPTCEHMPVAGLATLLDARHGQAETMTQNLECAHIKHVYQSATFDTLCSQAFGARNFHLVGTWAQRATLMLTFIMCPIIICVWLFASAPVFRLLVTTTAC